MSLSPERAVQLLKHPYYAHRPHEFCRLIIDQARADAWAEVSRRCWKLTAIVLVVGLVALGVWSCSQRFLDAA